ncbi:Peptidase S14 ClpP [Cardinium endosymbiont cEper1 of Encarsia pergandiella]|uniref:ATP-dependent Clp protease proteolytic subunit n=1 Tax=Cardinium endosymbiont of Encarsia pergandiella TaxID=249402 RepID=UPI00027E9B0E|nr:ATP-dependent Clp protease proteolytic subunit [Cardinium endosymbiont of Encarsia pergandiella]CCM10551.1 Peptidase S14 ClpP [Cardinium endosymbiont cEper1 of Encarsia pergandiella]
MFGLNYNCRLIRLGFSFFISLTCYNIALANKTKGKKKEVAVVSPIVQKKPNTNGTDAVSKTNLQHDLEAENALNRARLEKELSTIIAQIEQLRLKKEHQRLDKEIENENVRSAHDKAMLLLNMEQEKLTIELGLAQAKCMKKMEQYHIQLTELDKKIQLEKGQAQLLQETSHRLKSEIEVLEATNTRDKYIQKKPIYLKDPLIKKINTLVLSDRCIELNGTITPWKANYIVDQIHYFNNKNKEYPIFLVIGYSPGGYETAGCNILQAIEYSKAPVYVVVKSFAASMAALITTLAPKSYAYPNAIILHHHPASFLCGNFNLRATKEAYTNLDKTWKRLGGRVAKKMGISLERFNKKLYEKSMYGDWEEYGDQAKKLKWVDYVINSIQNSAISSLPDSAEYTFEQFIKHYYNANPTKTIELSAEEIAYNKLAPHDVNYSYRPDHKAQMMGK